ncbi:MAG: pilus assembly protein N-terminal domain-containing protein [Methyloligellaceae bacterium]
MASWLTPGAALASDISVAIDEAQLVRLDRPGSEVIIGNPSVADVSVQSGRLLVITGKSFGVTNVIVLDNGGKEVISRQINVEMDAKRTVVLQRGVVRQSLHCAPYCKPALMPGDDPDYTQGIAKSIITKFGTAQSAIDGTQASGQ